MAFALDGAAMAWLGDHGYDPVYGARPLKRVIQKSLVDPIARKLLSGELAEGAVIEVGVDGGGAGDRAGAGALVSALAKSLFRFLLKEAVDPTPAAINNRLQECNNVCVCQYQG